MCLTVAGSVTKKIKKGPSVFYGYKPVSVDNHRTKKTIAKAIAQAKKKLKTGCTCANKDCTVPQRRLEYAQSLNPSQGCIRTRYQNVLIEPGVLKAKDCHGRLVEKPYKKYEDGREINEAIHVYLSKKDAVKFEECYNILRVKCEKKHLMSGGLYEGRPSAALTQVTVSKQDIKNTLREYEKKNS